MIDACRVLILSERAERYQALLTAAGFDCQQLHCFTHLDQVTDRALNAPIVLGDPGLVSKLLPKLQQLQWIQSTWAGVTPLIDTERRNFKLTNVKGVFGPLMSEYVFAHLLSHVRRLGNMQRAQVSALWQPLEPDTLKGKTLGLLGLGSIGLHLAKTAKAFGMTTIGCARTAKARPNIDECVTTDRLADILHRVDYLVCALPSTPATQNLIDERILQHFKSSALLINVGRGDLIDDEALIDVLQQGRLGGAILDVFRQEPLPASHQFWNTPNLTITAHTAAPSFPEDIVPIFIDNHRRFIAGEPLQYLVDFDRGY